MRVLLPLLVAIALVSPVARPTQSTKPIPPGIREADKLPGPADVPPQIRPKGRRPDPTLLQEQARELSSLAQTVPDAIAQINKGTLPKDVNEKLKRIEKLSKTLRDEIAQ